MSPGTRVENKYELVELLGRGGMGEVWSARAGDERYAIKFVLPELRQHASIVDRFKSEILTVSQLRSPHVVRAHTFGVDSELGLYLVMELLHGESLRDVLGRGRIENPRDAVEYVIEACDALAEAHDRGIVHRDLKPENLFLTRSSPGEPARVKVLDFGIARTNDALRVLTQSGAFVGTRNYGSPEQFQDSSKVTSLADIWALGAILYELLSGQKAFPGEDLEPVSLILTASPRPLSELRPELPIALVACIDRCLAREARARYATASELRHALLPYGRAAIGKAFPLLGAIEQAPTERPLVEAPGGAAARGPVAPHDVSGSQATPDVAFGERDQLVDAVLSGRQSDGAPRPIVFMLGSGFSQPAVPSTAKIVELIKQELPDADHATLESLRSTSENLYQDAFELLHSRRPPPYAANAVVRRAVLNAFDDKAVKLEASEAAQRAQCQKLERQHHRWKLPRGVDHLGAIIHAGLARTSSSGIEDGPGDARFSSVHLTTNFDPLLEISIRKRGGTAVSTAIDRDGSIPGIDRQSCAVVHLHGRWDEGDTLHNDLGVERPVLRESLRRLLNGSTLVVVGYGGWKDVFMQTLKRAAAGGDNFQVLWCFFDNDPEVIFAKSGPLIAELKARLGQRIQFYRSIDTNLLFRDLLQRVLPPGQSLPPPPPDDTPPPPEPPSSTKIPIQSEPWLWIMAIPVAFAFLVLMISIGAGTGGGGTATATATATATTTAPPRPPRFTLSAQCPERPAPIGTVGVGNGLAVSDLCTTTDLPADSPLRTLAHGALAGTDPWYRLAASWTPAGDSPSGDRTLTIDFQLVDPLPIQLDIAGKPCPKQVSYRAVGEKTRPLKAPPPTPRCETSLSLAAGLYGKPIELFFDNGKCECRVAVPAAESRVHRVTACKPPSVCGRCDTCKARCVALYRSPLADCRTPQCKAQWTTELDGCKSRCDETECN